MRALQSKLVHMSAVAALAGYCYWCEQVETRVQVSATEKHKGSLENLLSPTIEPAPQRDPFHPVAQPQTGAGTSAADAEAAELKLAAAGNPADEFALAATIIHGPRRLAVINGSLYGEGEPLKSSVPNGQPCIVAQIHADRVLLDRGGKSVELQYSAGPSRAENPRREKAIPSRSLNSERRTP